MIEFLQMNINYESILYDRLLLKNSRNSEICKIKEAQLLELKIQLSRLKGLVNKDKKVIKLNPEVSQEDLFYNNILKYGNNN